MLVANNAGTGTHLFPILGERGENGELRTQIVYVFPCALADWFLSQAPQSQTTTTLFCTLGDILPQAVWRVHCSSQLRRDSTRSLGQASQDGRLITHGLVEVTPLLNVNSGLV